MADLATLKIAVDSRPVDQASNDLDELATSANRAERATAGLTNQTKATGAAMAGMNNAVRQARAAQEAAAQAMGGVAGRTKLASHEVTNLAFQFQDLGVQIAGGANPLTAFMQQGSQISGIMMQSGMSVGVFTKAVGSMIATAAGAVLLNPIFLGVAAAVGGTALAFKGFSDQIENKAPVDEYIKSLGLTKEEAAKLKDTHVTLGDAARGAWNMIREGLGLDEVFSTLDGWVDSSATWLYNAFKQSVASVYGAFKATFDNITFVYSNMPALLVDAARAGFNGMINIMQGAINASIAGLNYLAQKSNEVFGTSFGQFGKVDLSAYKATYSAAGKELGSRFSSSFNSARAEALAGFDKWEAATLAERNKRLKGQADKLIADRKKGAEKASKDSNKEAEKLAKELAELELRVMNGLTDTMRELQETISAINAGDVAQLQDELAKKSQARADAFKKEAEERAKANEELRETVDYLDNLLGLQGGMGRLFNALKSGFGDAFKSISDTFAKLRDGLAGSLAKLGTSFKEIAGGAAIGGIAAQATGGSALGGTIGGGIGQALGSKFLSKALGSFAGPLGSIAGGLLGGLIGGLFTKTKQASATLSNIGGQAVVSSIKGNDAQLRGIANNMATGLLKGIANIAEQLGGALGGAVSLSIGQRKKDFVVDPTGQGRTKGAGVINFGEDQAAAIAYATQLAIQQGIITGLSAGANTLIKAGGDLQAQLEKALKFEQVFKDLREQTDPLGYALDNLSKEMEKLKAVFAEAGATAADYAALEELYSIKRQRVIMDAERPRRELEIQLMEATGDAAGALAAKRMLELDAMDASLRGLQQQIYAAQDAAAARELEAVAQEAALQEQLAAAEAQRAAEAELARQREEAAQRVKEAEDALRQAYDREASAFRDTIDRFRDLGKTLREFAATLLPLNGNGRASLNELNRKFRETAALARLGNTEAMAALPGIGGELRDAIIDTATDRVSMLRRLSEVRAETEAVADVADRQVSIAQQQLDALTTQVEQFITINESVLSVRDAIVALQQARAAQASVAAQTVAPQTVAPVANQGSSLGGGGGAPSQSLMPFTGESTREGGGIGMGMMYNNGVPIPDQPNWASSGTAWATLWDRNASPSDIAELAWAARSTAETWQRIGHNQDANQFFLNEVAKYGIPGAVETLAAELGVPAFASGGIHSGGLRVVGENGPELEATGPSRIYNANQLGNMMGGGATADEVRALRDELKVVMFQIAKNTGKTSDQLQRWDGDGLPDARGF